MVAPRLFDAHLDLAYLAENGRDLSRDRGECGGPHPPAAVTFPALRAGGVRACLATIFTEAGGDDAVAYPPGDGELAHAAGLRQLRRYERWGGEGGAGGAGLVRGLHSTGDGALRVGILMECADPIRTAGEVEWWAGRGVIAVGMAWARGSRYATGNAPESGESGVGLTDAGRDLVREMDRRGVAHDVSHLSDRALEDLLSLTGGRVMASHSNCRALLGGGGDPRLLPRHLSDEMIREIARRGGVIGLNLYARFLRAGLSETERPTLDDAVAHVERVCELVGHRRAVGLGSDLDGGFSAERLPVGIDSAADLPRLLGALAERGWPPDDVAGFAWGNWARFWGLEG
ncbi:MAG: membrane dipeptidase [Phycisphaerales bacterium]